jgi:hypothetical protein
LRKRGDFIVVGAKKGISAIHGNPFALEAEQ